MIKKLLPLFLLLFLLPLPLVSCTNPPPADPPGSESPESSADGSSEGTAESDTAPQELALNGYYVIRPADIPEDEVNRYASFYRALGALGGELDLDLHIADDYLKRGTEPDSTLPEILCGETNRYESASAYQDLPGYYDHMVAVYGKKLCLVANDKEGMDKAIAYLLANTELRGETLYYTGGLYIGRSEYPLKDKLIGGIEPKSYTIVYGQGNKREKQMAEMLSSWFALQTGIKPSVTDDSQPESKHEILIGKTLREGSVNPEALDKNAYVILQKGDKLILSAGSPAGYNTITERMEILMGENKMTADLNENGTFEGGTLDGKRVMFIGNSFLYYGYCTTTKNKIVFGDKGYFYQVASAMGEEVDVTSVTYGGAGLKSLYERLTSTYPKYYGTSGEMDNFYNQDFVILQQEGSNASSTAEYADKLMALFPPETRFCFFIHHHNVQKNHTNVLNTAKNLRDEKGVIYISAGHLIYDVWSGKTQVPGATLPYNKNSFVVNHSDSHHPNYLNGYLTALSCYYGITGNSILDCPHDFVRTTMEYYTKATSNYDEILASEADMRGLKQLVEEYIERYNP